METIVIENIQSKKSNQVIRFVDPSTLPLEALINPDYRLNLLQKQYEGMNTISCSKCHHCR